MASPPPLFIYDLGDPECYLTAERINAALPVVPEWVPVVRAEVAGGSAGPGRARAAEAIDRPRLEARAAEFGLQPVRWPAGWPPDTRTAMLAATYAKRIGRGVAFSLAAFRQAFAAGRDLGAESTVLIAGAACEMHPAALLKGIGLRSVVEALDEACVNARGRGVVALPAIVVGERVVAGADCVERASVVMGAQPL